MFKKNIKLTLLFFSMIPLHNVLIAGKITNGVATFFQNLTEDAIGDAIQSGKEIIKYDGKNAEIDLEIKQLIARRSKGEIEEDVFKADYERLTRKALIEEKKTNTMRDTALNIASSTGNFFKKTLETEAEEKAKIAEVAAKQAVSNKGLMERVQFLTNPSTLKNLSSFLAVSSLGLFGAWFLTKSLYHYAKTLLGIPTLIRESSRVGKLKSLLFPQKPTNLLSSLDDIILPEKTKQEIQTAGNIIAQMHNNNMEYQHMLLYGEPGTGKTLIAKTLATLSGMDYAILSAADFLQFKTSDGIQKMHEIFDWANNGDRGLILFIDEADALFSDRTKSDESKVALINTFLSHTSDCSNKFMLILATNHKDVLDSAVKNRINKEIEIPLPSEKECYKLFDLYMNKCIINHPTQPLIVDKNVTNEFKHTVAKKIEGLSGRIIKQLISEIRTEGIIANNGIITTDIITRLANRKIEQKLI